MPLIDKPITERNGYRGEDVSQCPIQHDLEKIMLKHNLHGCVLVSFDDDRVGTRSCGKVQTFSDAMDALAVRILTDIDDGRHNPLSPETETEGQA